jgi:uncharacterized protein (DUF427 family)
MWTYRGQQRPDFAEEPGPGQESVWDYPRPPAIDPAPQAVKVSAGERLLAGTQNALRVLETASPPTVYLPPEDVNFDLLRPVAGRSFCEWKGQAQYWALADSRDGVAIGWSYPAPTNAFKAIAGWISFYPGRVACLLNNERVRAQEGGFYGGWVTDNIKGPWKGQAGTGGW